MGDFKGAFTLDSSQYDPKRPKFTVLHVKLNEASTNAIEGYLVQQKTYGAAFPTDKIAKISLPESLLSNSTTADFTKSITSKMHIPTETINPDISFKLESLNTAEKQKPQKLSKEPVDVKKKSSLSAK